MTMANNGKEGAPPPPPHCHVGGAPLTFTVDKQHGQGPTGPVSIVVLRIESVNGSFVFPMPADFAVQMGRAIQGAGSGIVIAGTPPPGAPGT
jgi:hypothetical protein